jgi:hypothetical protein
MQAMTPTTAGLAIFGRFWVRGDLPYTVKPYESTRQPGGPADFYKFQDHREYDLHQLLFFANSRHARPEGQSLVRPLRGYRAGDRVAVNDLACDVLRSAELAEMEKERDLDDPTDSHIFESAAMWISRNAVGSLLFLAGVEGGLALLRSPRVPEYMKNHLGTDIFWRNDPDYLSHSEITAPEFDLLADALKERALSPYFREIAGPLIRQRDPRVIPHLEHWAGDHSVHEYFRDQARDALALMRQSAASAALPD